LSHPPVYFCGMLQRIACINWKTLAALSAAEIKEITSKTNRFLAAQRPKPVENPSHKRVLCSADTVMHKSL
jgi:hypothetical protein